jgi:hypothetical protein
VETISRPKQSSMGVGKQCLMPQGNFPCMQMSFFMKHANSFMKTVMKKALQIERYWSRVEFAPGKGAIHLHIVAIAKNKAYLQDFYNASSLHQKAEVLNNSAIHHLYITADVKVNDNQDYRPDYLTSPLTRRYSECTDEEEDVRQLAQDCMTHECNRYCLKSTKAGTPQTCRSHYGTETEFGKLDTPGMELIEKARIY